jgi:hypothetical protein
MDKLCAEQPRNRFPGLGAYPQLPVPGARGVAAAALATSAISLSIHFCIIIFHWHQIGCRLNFHKNIA